MGIDPQTGALVPGGVEAETEQVLANLEAVLAARGLTLRDVVKTTVFLADMADFEAMNEVYARRSRPHARAHHGRGARAAARRPVEIDVVAIRPG